MTKTLVLGSSLLVLALLLTGCQQVESPKIQSSSTPTPKTTSVKKSYPQVAALPYKEAEITPDLQAGLPFNPEEFFLDNGKFLSHAPTVNIPKLKTWVKTQVAEGWILKNEATLGDSYSASLTRGEDYILVDAMLSKDYPFTSIIISTAAPKE